MFQFPAPHAPGMTYVPIFPSTVPSWFGGVNSGPMMSESASASARSRISGVKSIRSSGVTPWRSKAGGRLGIGCVGEVASPGTVDCGTSTSSIGHTGSPVRRSKV